MVTFAKYLVINGQEVGYGTGVDLTVPSGLKATAGSGQVALSWVAPSSGGSVTDYSVQYRVSPAGAWATFAHTASTATSLTVTGLTNGTKYDFHVAAVRSGVVGTYTAAVSATPKASTTSTTLFGYNTNNKDSPLSQRLSWWSNRAPTVRRYLSGMLPASFNLSTGVCPEKRVVYSFKRDSQFSAAQLAAGAGNARLKSWVESIPPGWTVDLCYNHEPNDEFRNGVFTPAQFKAAYAQFYPVIKGATLNAGVTVRLISNFMAFRLTDTPTYFDDSWVPPHGTADMLTFDCYGNPGSFTTGTAYDSTYPDPKKRCADMFAIIDRLGWWDSWGVLEVNAPQRNWDTDESARVDWIVGMVELALSRPVPPKLYLPWENPPEPFAKWDQSFGRVAGDRDHSPMIAALAPYIEGSP